MVSPLMSKKEILTEEEENNFIIPKIINSESLNKLLATKIVVCNDCHTKT